MRLLTDLPSWAGFSILLLIDALVLALARAHDQKQMWKILHSERQRMSAWAEEHADQLAEAKVRERLIEERMERANRM
jgi:hypothetical protein